MTTNDEDKSHSTADGAPEHSRVKDGFEADRESDALAEGDDVNFQLQIDESLRRLFPLSEPHTGHLAAVEAGLQVKAGVAPRRVSAPRALGWLALAGSILIGLLFVFSRERIPFAGPSFEQRPLAQLYREEVEAGFQPYYDCSDPERFAAVFHRRQGQALRLLTLPDDSRMLGVSYPGGLSRETTAILFRIEQQPVIVFVDRLGVDTDRADANAEPGLNVVRRERHGLVLYEVTPLDDSRVMDLIRPLNE